MKILHLDLGMGAAGDMLTAALISLLSEEEQKEFVATLNSIGMPKVNVELTDDIKCGVTGKHVHVYVDGEEEISNDVHEHHHHEHEHEHEHTHEHSHGGETHSHPHTHDGEHDHEHHHHDHVHEHFHSSMEEVSHIIDQLAISVKVKTDVKAIYDIIANAEAKVHGKPVNAVHFHEVGKMDAICDITAVAMLLDIIKPDKIIATPINTGFGKVKCDHGIMPVPAPATAEILTGVPIYSGHFEGEMCTPTGAAIVKYFADEFKNAPLMTPIKTGYGTGNKDFPSANVVKAILGTADFSDNTNNTDTVIELRANVDDITGEDIQYAVEILMESGAKDAFITPVIMKKGRPGYLLTVLCNSSDKETIAHLIFKHTSTIGIRECVMSRMVLNREFATVATTHGNVNIKISEGYGVRKAKPEFDDLKAISRSENVSITELRKEVDRLF